MPAGQPGALVKATSRLKWNILISNFTNLKIIIALSTFFWANQLSNTYNQLSYHERLKTLSEVFFSLLQKFGFKKLD